MNANEVMKKAIADAGVTQKELATTMQLKWKKLFRRHRHHRCLTLFAM